MYFQKAGGTSDPRSKSRPVCGRSNSYHQLSLKGKQQEGCKAVSYDFSTYQDVTPALHISVKAVPKSLHVARAQIPPPLTEIAKEHYQAPCTEWERELPSLILFSQTTCLSWLQQA